MPLTNMRPRNGRSVVNSRRTRSSIQSTCGKPAIYYFVPVDNSTSKQLTNHTIIDWYGGNYHHHHLNKYFHILIQK
jgi:hypothetical protein